MIGHDFTPINLSFTKKHDARRFSAQLLEAMLMSEGPKRDSPHRGIDVLGRSPISEPNSGNLQRAAYTPPDGEHYKRFRDLSAIDAAFRQFLADRKIIIENIFREDETKRAGQARKYIWSVAVRLEHGPSNVFHRKDMSVSERPPSRKTIPAIYLGYDSLMAICEGNPRTTIGLLRPIVRMFSSSSQRISDETQSEFVKNAIAKYLSLLSTIPLRRPDGGVSDGTVVDLIDEIGEFFSQEVNGSTFKAEPSLTLVIDSGVRDNYITAIGNAMNQGAFVMISGPDGLFDFGQLRGARLRLSYLLCPRYHIPLTTGQPVNLSSILRKRSAKRQTVLSIRDLFEGGDFDSKI